MLAIGRALMSRSEMLLLDEPSLGLAPAAVHEVFQVIKEINRAGTTILLVEQNVRMALLIANWGFVLEMGRVMLSDTATNLLADE
jgi:branched-chain amino acid transport system ATP-binding protein